jgi:hypothetical protein
VVLARAVGNRRLSTACHLWAFAALTGSAGARRYYDAHRARGATHHQALRALANRLVGILQGCLHHRQPYSEQLAWPASTAEAGRIGRGVPSPGVLASLFTWATAVQVGHRCREVKRDGQPASSAACLDRA